MRVAALFDIHGNLPALEAVLGEVRQSGADLVVVGGDVLPGPWPRETLERLLHLEIPVRFVHGNGELAVLAELEATHPEAVSYWGTTSGAILPEPIREVLRWTARQIPAELAQELAAWPKTIRLSVDGLGEVLFCHGTPRSETECFTRLTPEDLLLPVFAEVEASVVVSGHTHMAFDRRIGRVRVVNAGSVGMPFGLPGADWALLGPDVELRHTSFDLASAAERVRASRYPQAGELAAQVQEPPTEAAMLDLLTSASFPCC